jgi:hypothetical protein
MRDPGMAGFLDRNAIQDGGGVLLVGVGFIEGRRGSEQREGVEDGSLVILGSRAESCCIALLQASARSRCGTLSESL